MTVQIGSRQLLVSVRSVVEAKAALSGGADIVDIKEPKLGSLGRADETVIDRIARTIVDQPGSVPVSTALGEVRDHDRSGSIQLSERVSYAKLGLSGLRDDRRWTDRWVQVRQQYQSHRDSAIQWIAVIYADATAAHSPSADEVISAAIETECVGVLVDTWSKTNGHLLDAGSPVELDQWAKRLHHAGLFFAVAGRLTLELLPQLSDVSADVLAVRSAACDGHDRQAAVNSLRVKELREAIEQLPHRHLPTGMTATVSHER